MADVNIFITDTSGTYDPPLPVVKRGDTVIFHSFLDDLDVVLCMEEGKIFGATKFVIPAGHNLRLIVQDFMPKGTVGKQVNCHVTYIPPGNPAPDCPPDLANGITPIGLKPTPPPD